MIDQLSQFELPQISFNYFGQTDQVFEAAELFRLAEEASGPHSLVKNDPNHSIDVIARVAAHQLKLAFVYSRNIHDQETVRCFAEDVVSELRLMIAYANGSTHPHATLVDHALFSWDDKDVERIGLCRATSPQRVLGNG